MKVCKKCGKEKPATKEYFSKNGEYLRGECKDCQKEYHKKNYQENKDAIDAKNREWRENNRDVINEIAKRTYEKHREKTLVKRRKWYEENKEKESARYREYYNSPAGQASRVNKYARRKIRLGGKNDKIGKEDWLLIMNSCDWKCFYCKCELTKENRTIDHFVPLSRGGDHSIFNLVASCDTCNFSKQDFLYYEWAEKKTKEERDYE